MAVLATASRSSSTPKFRCLSDVVLGRPPCISPEPLTDSVRQAAALKPRGMIVTRDRVFRIGGIVSGGVLIAFGIVVIVLAVMGNNTVKIYCERVTDNVARRGTAKPQNGGRDFLGSTRASDGNVRRYLSIRLFIALNNVAGNLRVDQSGVDRIYPDAVLDVFEGGCPSQTNDSVLGRNVRGDAGIASQCADRGIVDNCAAALVFHLPQLVLHATPYAPQIDSDYAVPLFVGAVGDRSLMSHPEFPWLACVCFTRWCASRHLRLARYGSDN